MARIRFAVLLPRTVRGDGALVPGTRPANDVAEGASRSIVSRDPFDSHRCPGRGLCDHGCAVRSAGNGRGSILNSLLNHYITTWR